MVCARSSSRTKWGKGRGAIGSLFDNAALLLEIGDEGDTRGVLALVGGGGANGQVVHAGIHSAVNAAASRIEMRALLEAHPIVEGLVERWERIVGLGGLAMAW